MYQQLVSYLDGIPFFHSSVFGIISLVFLGLSWCLVGAIAGNAPKKNIRMEHLLLSGGLIAALIIFIFMLISGVSYTSNTPKIALYLTLAAFFASGVCCYFQHVLTSRAMQNGPNGVIWALTQSAMIFPFIAGIVFYGVKFTILRLAGIILVLAALVIFGGTKEHGSSSGKGKWKLDAFTVLIVISFSQVVTSLPFYYKETEGVSAPLCICCMMLGYAAAAAALMAPKMDKAALLEFKNAVCRRDFWVYCILLLPTAAVIAVILEIPGMRAMADNGLGGMSFPLMVGSCICGFSLYSAVVLKERFKAAELVALAFCIGGLCMLCIAA
ncbi:MAG: hypothetical protein IKC77_01480 [Lentisphaeria bacterium]|nr:hypothetical protein [Lentisphaeria bacterium]